MCRRKKRRGEEGREGRRKERRKKSVFCLVLYEPLRRCLFLNLKATASHTHPFIYPSTKTAEAGGEVRADGKAQNCS